MIPAGALAFFSGTFFRAPFELLNRQIQTGEAATNEEAIQNVFFKLPAGNVWQNVQKAWILCMVRGVPFGALQCTLYELFKDRLDLVQYGVPSALMPIIWGLLAGGLTGAATNPPDVILGTIAKMEQPLENKAGSGSSSAAVQSDGDNVWQQLVVAGAKINSEEGVAGFFRGAGARAAYLGPESCIWFVAYESLLAAATFINDV